MKNFIHHMVAKYNNNGNGTMGGGANKNIHTMTNPRANLTN